MNLLYLINESFANISGSKSDIFVFLSILNICGYSICFFNSNNVRIPSFFNSNNVALLNKLRKHL